MSDTTDEPRMELLRTTGTVACDRFFIETDRLMHFIGFVSTLATRADDVTRIAREALQESENPPESFDEKTGAIAELRRQRQFVLQMMLSRAVDNFLSYLSELVALLYKTRPETMRARLDEDSRRRGEQPESIPLDLVLQHATMEDLLTSLVERRVTNLSHRSMASLAAYLQERLGFAVTTDSTVLAQIVRAVETRNVIAHNRGVVSSVFMQRVEPDDLSVGDAITLEVDEVFDTVGLLGGVAADIDARAIEKWSLPVQPLSIESLSGIASVPRLDS